MSVSYHKKDKSVVTNLLAYGFFLMCFAARIF